MYIVAINLSRFIVYFTVYYCNASYEELNINLNIWNNDVVPEGQNSLNCVLEAFRAWNQLLVQVLLHIGED